MGWVYLKMKPFVIAWQFMECMAPTAQTVFRRLLKELENTRIDDSQSTDFNTEQLGELLNAVDRGAFTLSEIRLDAIQMRPLPRKALNPRNRHWDFGCIFRRDCTDDLPEEIDATVEDVIQLPPALPSSSEQRKLCQQPVPIPAGSAAESQRHLQKLQTTAPNKNMLNRAIASESEFGSSDFDGDTEAANSATVNASTNARNPRSSRTMGNEPPKRSNHVPFWLRNGNNANRNLQDNKNGHKMHPTSPKQFSDGSTPFGRRDHPHDSRRSLESPLPITDERDDFLGIDYAADVVDSDLEDR